MRERRVYRGWRSTDGTPRVWVIYPDSRRPLKRWTLASRTAYQVPAEWQPATHMPTLLATAILDDAYLSRELSDALAPALALALMLLPSEGWSMSMELVHAWAQARAPKTLLDELASWPPYPDAIPFYNLDELYPLVGDGYIIV